VLTPALRKINYLYSSQLTVVLFLHKKSSGWLNNSSESADSCATETPNAGTKLGSTYRMPGVGPSKNLSISSGVHRKTCCYGLGGLRRRRHCDVVSGVVPGRVFGLATENRCHMSARQCNTGIETKLLRAASRLVCCFDLGIIWHR
jgi:hypothetical protein